MNRYKYLLSNKPLAQLIGIFPYGLIIDDKNTSHKTEEIHFLNDGIDFLKTLAQKNVSVVMFINQFKPAIPFEKFEAFVGTVETFSRQQGIDLKGVYWCPGTDKRDPFVVPNPGMFHRVTDQTGIKWDGVSVLSANDTDLIAAKKVKANPIKIGRKTQSWDTYETLDAWVNSLQVTV